VVLGVFRLVIARLELLFERVLCDAELVEIRLRAGRRGLLRERGRDDKGGTSISSPSKV
jgi:hypothetical protein